MRVAALVLSWNAPQALADCLTSLARQRNVALEVLVVDNASQPPAADWLPQRFPAVDLLQQPFNRGFSGGMNDGLRRLAARRDPPEVVVLINQDTVLAEDCLARLSAPLRDDAQAVACGPLMFYPDGRLQHAGVSVDPCRATVRHYDADNPPLPAPTPLQPVDCLNGAVLALRRCVDGQDLLLDEGYSPAYYEDIDLCRRLRRSGGKLLLAADATVVHQEGLSTPDLLRRAALYHRGRLRYVFKHHSADQVLDEFVPAELAVLAEHVASPIEGRALRWAYDMTLSGLAEICAARERDGIVLTDAERRQLMLAAGRLQQQPGQLWQRRSGG